MPEPLPSFRDLNSPALSSEQRARLVQRLRRGLAALSLVGAVLVALPLTQLLRYQSAEVKSLSAKRASLDPIGRAVSLQRGLMAHAELAHQVLRGEDKLEADRRQRQAEVDGRLAALNVALASGNWELALGEADELRDDWLQLARQVMQRQIDAAGSTDGHRLLVEQTLQVIDLVTTAGRNGRGEETAEGDAHSAQFADELPAGTATALRALPRLAWMTSQLQQGQQAPGLALLEGTLARTLLSIERAAAGAGTDTRADTDTDQAALAQAARKAAAASSGYFQLLRQGAATPAALKAAERAALQAQMSLFEQAHGLASGMLAAQSRAVSQRRALLLGGLCFGVLIALGLLSALRRDLRRLAEDDQRRADDRAAPPATDGQSGGRQQAELLLQRLRESQPVAALPDAVADRAPVDEGASRPR